MSKKIPSDSEKRPRTEIITPIAVDIGNGNKDHKGDQVQLPRNLMTVGLSLLVLIVGGLMLLTSVSRSPVETAPEEGKRDPVETEANPVSPPPAPPPEQTNDASPAAQQKEQAAEAKLAEFLQTRKALVAKGAAAWGGESYERMERLARSADALFVEKEFGSAAEQYEQALAAADVLRLQTGAALQRLLDEGTQALEQGRGEQALSHFSVALKIEPQNPVALKNLRRAQNMEAVQQLMASGEEHEKDRRLSLAHTDYQEALRLDPDSNKAREAFERVREQVEAAGFQQQMSAGFTALYSKDYDHARNMFIKARAVRPDSGEVRDALEQVDAAMRIDRIENLRRKAQALESVEKWQQAHETFQAVLKLDAAIQFALQGSERTAKMLRLEKRMTYYLENQDKLESDASLEKSLQLIAEAQSLKSRGPRLQEKLQKLNQMVTAAQTPVAVIINSDSHTQVSVYRVGKLGGFARRELQLRPGTYTVVGVRDGFQDVRKQVLVKAGQGPVRITVTCTDEI